MSNLKTSNYKLKLFVQYSSILVILSIPLNLEIINQYMQCKYIQLNIMFDYIIIIALKTTST